MLQHYWYESIHWHLLLEIHRGCLNSTLGKVTGSKASFSVHFLLDTLVTFKIILKEYKQGVHNDGKSSHIFMKSLILILFLMTLEGGWPVLRVHSRSMQCNIGNCM